MTIESNKVVSLVYALSVDDEQGDKMLVETVEKDDPMVFLYGQSGLPEKFEENIAGLQEGDNFQFSLDPENGFGYYNEDAVVMMPTDVFQVDGKVDSQMLQVGNVIPMADGDGNRLQGKVLEVNKEGVLMDFNHPLAGMNMHFEGQVVGVRNASSEELAHGHVHGPGGHHH
jgi:FKBP-type peptidyl-prolyl cis-trans isomerase SlyD